MEKKQKRAIPMTKEQTVRANKMGVMIYGLSFVGFILIMMIMQDFSVIGLVMMILCFAGIAFLGNARGSEENTHTIMSVLYLLGFIFVTLTSTAEVYPIVFASVFALVVYQNVRLVYCGTFATAIVNGISIAKNLMLGADVSDEIIKLVSTILFCIFSVYTILQIYNSTKENLDAIGEQTKEALHVAEEVQKISTQIMDDFHGITDGMQVITEQASENKVALNDITSASETNLQQVNNQTGLTQNIYAIVEETQANAEKAATNAVEAYDTVVAGTKMSEEMKHQAEGVTAAIQKTYDVIHDLVAQIQGVSSITDAILSISSQTNLLALNASIEAARAGEAGKGFAVVADEIRSLAEQTKTSTEEITGIMNQLIEVANSSVETMSECVEGINVQNVKIDEVNGSFEQTRENVTELKNMVDVIIDGVTKVSENTEEIVTSVMNVSENTDRVTQLSGDGATGAETIFDTVQAFSQTILELQKQVEELQATVMTQNPETEHTETEYTEA